MKTNRVFYGLLNADKNYKVTCYGFYNREDTIRFKNRQIDFLLMEHPEVEMIYEVPNTEDMHDYFVETIHKKTMAAFIEFKVVCEQKGFKVYDRKTDMF